MREDGIEAEIIVKTPQIAAPRPINAFFFRLGEY